MASHFLDHFEYCCPYNTINEHSTMVTCVFLVVFCCWTNACFAIISSTDYDVWQCRLQRDKLRCPCVSSTAAGFVASVCPSRKAFVITGTVMMWALLFLNRGWDISPRQSHPIYNPSIHSPPCTSPRMTSPLLHRAQPGRPQAYGRSQ